MGAIRSGRGHGLDCLPRNRPPRLTTCGDETVGHVASLVYGLLLAAAAMVGDLAESLLKRDMGCKDSSPWLPGLGGVLDMVDSLLVATPACLSPAGRWHRRYGLAPQDRPTVFSGSEIGSSFGDNQEINLRYFLPL